MPEKDDQAAGAGGSAGSSPASSSSARRRVRSGFSGGRRISRIESIPTSESRQTECGGQPEPTTHPDPPRPGERDRAGDFTLGYGLRATDFGRWLAGIGCGPAARAHVLEHHRPEHEAERYRALYAEMLGSKPATAASKAARGKRSPTARRA